jgi:hypothetical protein
MTGAPKVMTFPGSMTIGHEKMSSTRIFNLGRAPRKPRLMEGG